MPCGRSSVAPVRSSDATCSSETPAAGDTATATREGSMTLTPNGWESDQLRFHSSEPIKPH